MKKVYSAKEDQSILLKMKFNIDNTFVKYTAIGIVNTIIGYLMSKIWVFRAE